MLLRSTIKIIYFKELKEVIRDRRSLTSAIMLSLLMPVFMLAGFYFASQEAQKAQTAEIEIMGANNAPSLISFLTSKGFHHKKGAELELLIPDNYREHIATGYRVEITIKGDMSKNTTVNKRLSALIQAYGSQLASSRLLARGISPLIMSPLIVNKHDTGEASSIARFMAPLFVFILLMTPIYSVMPACIDCIAGERERHGLYPMLLQPINPIAIPIGKWLMLLTVGTVGLTLAIISGFIAYSNIELDGLTLGLNLSFFSGILFVLVSIPTIGLLAAIMMGMASYAKTFKEGQTYVGLGTIFPVFVAGIGSFASDSVKPFLPLWSEATVLGDNLAATNIQWLPWILIVIVYSGLISAFLYWMSRSMQHQALESAS